MKMNSIQLPKVMDYYIAAQYKQLLNDKFLDGNCEEIDNKIYLIIDYDPDLFPCLKLYIDKTQTTTVGNMFVYEYEHDIKSFKGDRDFIIYLEDGAHVCELESSHIDNEHIILIFKLN